jgi:hypothetical protein
VIAGPGLYTCHEIDVPLARPIYSEGGYAAVTPDAYPTPFPDVRHVPGARLAERSYGVAPYGAYLYRPLPNARIIRVQ